MQEIEKAYQILSDGTRYVYDRVSANERIAGNWIRSELSAAASAYQEFTRDVWQAIIEKTQEANQKQICQATQIARVKDSLAFLAEANVARSQHLANFQGNVENWAIAHQQKVASLEEELRKAQEEIQRLAARIPLPETPRDPAQPQPQRPVNPFLFSPFPIRPPSSWPWRSPVHPTTSSLVDALGRFTTIPSPPAPGPVSPGPKRRRPPAVPSPAPDSPVHRGVGGPPQPPQPPR